MYWELLSLQNMAFPATYLRDFADSSAAIAMSADVGGHAVREQPPTTMRVHRSTTATRKSQPSPVRRYVMSPTSL